VWRKIFGLRMRKLRDSGEKGIMQNSMAFIPYKNLGRSKQG
jgi:hypothetical protein